MNGLYRISKHTKSSHFKNLTFFSTNSCCTQISKLSHKNISKLNRIEPVGWLLLVIPATTFGLGVWQIQRKSWKENLIADLKRSINSDPIKLPENLGEISKFEYRPIHVRGTFLHDKEIYIGPRSLLIDGDASTKSSLMSNNTNTSQGFLVVTPFKLQDRDETILVNRGWVPTKNVNPKTRQKGQVNEVVDVIGILRLNENRPNFAVKNKEGSNLYFYRDLESMCAATGASPIFLDQTNEFNDPYGPVGGQTRITLRNEHFSYILTWFSLCGATTYMWCKKFILK